MNDEIDEDDDEFYIKNLKGKCSYCGKLADGEEYFFVIKKGLLKTNFWSSRNKICNDCFHKIERDTLVSQKIEDIQWGYIVTSNIKRKPYIYVFTGDPAQDRAIRSGKIGFGYYMFIPFGDGETSRIQPHVWVGNRIYVNFNSLRTTKIVREPIVMGI